MANTSTARYSDWDAAINKLTKLTQDGELEWDAKEDFRGRGEDVAVSPAFSANVNGRNVLVYEYNYKHFTDVDEWVWQTDVAIEFVDEAGHLVYPWQGTRPSRNRLLDAIRYRSAQVDEFLREFLRS